MKVLVSNDLGKKFRETKSAPAFPKDDGRALANIWSMEAGDGKKELWCGVEPAALFHSDDLGNSWEMVPAISNHDHSRKWQPGNGGLCMHTIVRDGSRMHLGISTGGHYRSEVGVLRSDDSGQTWRSIAKGLPSDFGFPIVVHPHNPDVVYVVPLEPMTRTCPGGVPAVWRSENGGSSWKRLVKGLPKKDSYFTILRDAMTTDQCKSPALYFGTTTGQLWIGRDGGEEWSCLFDSLPPIHCVKTAMV